MRWQLDAVFEATAGRRLRGQLWFDTVIRVGIEFSSNRRSLESLRSLIQHGFGMHRDWSGHSVLLLGAFLWIGGLVGLLCCAGRWHQFSEQRRNAIVASVVFLFGATMSVVVTGPFGHYLVQIVPWFAIFLGCAIASVSVRMVRWSLAGSIGAVLITVAVEHTRGSYGLLLKRIEQGKSLAHGPAYAIAEYLQAQAAGLCT